MKDIIIAGPPQTGKTELVHELLICGLGHSNAIFILDMGTADVQINQFVRDNMGFTSRGSFCVVFDGVVTSPGEALKAVELIKRWRARLKEYKIDAIYVDNGTNFVLTDKTN